jgi:hypothetical protein
MGVNVIRLSPWDSILVPIMLRRLAGVYCEAGVCAGRRSVKPF